MSSLANPALETMAVPSPVQEWADVHEKYERPKPLQMRGRGLRQVNITAISFAFVKLYA